MLESLSTSDGNKQDVDRNPIRLLVTDTVHEARTDGENSKKIELAGGKGSDEAKIDPEKENNSQNPEHILVNSSGGKV